jgi:Protein of unknown function (DUF1552)
MTFLTKAALPRRTFLRGVGAAIALPLLDAMVPPITALAQTPARPKTRFGAVFIPNGAIMESWTPTGVGPSFEFSPSLKPLEPFRDSLVVITNLVRAATPGGDHAVSAAGWLTGVGAKRTEAEDILAGVTIDQVVAAQIGQDTPFPSLELATEDFTGYIGACTTGYSCAYANTISWSTPTTPLPMEINPRAVFERLFGEPGSPAQRTARRQRDRSILDFVTQETTRLRGGLGARDRNRLDQYLDNVREIERRIQHAEAHNTSRILPPEAPIGVPESYEEHVGLMYDLLAVAYESELTRVFTYMVARELSARTYPQAGVPEQHHQVSHHGNDPATIAKVVKINTYHSHLLAKFIARLKSTPDGDGSLLDHSLIVYGGGMGNPNQHAAGPLPMVAIGGGAGRGNRHLQNPPNTPVGNLWLGVANSYGSPLESFGVSNGRVELS